MNSQSHYKYYNAVIVIHFFRAFSHCALLRNDLIARIEAVTLKIIKQISSEQAPCISYFSGRNDISKLSIHKENLGCSVDPDSQVREGTMFFNDALIDFVEEQSTDNRDTQNLEKTTVDFAVKSSRKKFVLMMVIMAEVHHLLLTNTTKTRRAFYYDLKKETTKYLVPIQQYVDRALNDIANLLECAPWNLSELVRYYLIIGSLIINIIIKTIYRNDAIINIKKIKNMKQKSIN